tara:strand:+ start:556 stop:678 length:123 start_codon:yes stop_codon:yes gene_type:complete
MKKMNIELIKLRLELVDAKNSGDGLLIMFLEQEIKKELVK